MFKLAFAIIVVLLLWLQSLFVQTVHVVRGDVHVFKYNWVAWLFLVLFSLVCVGFAEFARRVMKDRILAVLCLLGIPLFGLVSLQLLYERVEVSEKLLIHRREPPHTKFNADIPWDSIQAAVKIEHEQGGNVGYQFQMKDGQLHELPSNTVLTSAQREIDRLLAARRIPVQALRIPIPK